MEHHPHLHSPALSFESSVSCVAYVVCELFDLLFLLALASVTLSGCTWVGYYGWR